MSDLLQDLIDEWKRDPQYTNVEAQYWAPGQRQEQECPQGCKLEIDEDTPTGWSRIPMLDAYRQTRI